jgi:hypothetical protein
VDAADFMVSFCIRAVVALDIFDIAHGNMDVLVLIDRDRTRCPPPSTASQVRGAGFLVDETRADV